MALHECPECRAEISTLAKACPRCGFPLIVRKVANSSELKFPELNQAAKNEFSWILQPGLKKYLKIAGNLIAAPFLLTLLPYGGWFAFIFLIFDVRWYCRAFTFKTLTRGCDLSNPLYFYTKTYFAFALRMAIVLISSLLIGAIFFAILASIAGSPISAVGGAGGPAILGLLVGLLFSVDVPRKFTKKNLT